MNQLKKARVSLNLNQREVAQLANISPSYYNEIEKGKKKPSYDVMKRLAVVLKSDPSIFFTSDVA